MEYTGFQDGVDIDVILTSSTLHKYASTEFNNYYHPPLTDSKISTSKNYSISTLTSPSVTSINDEVFLLQNPIRQKIKYSDFSKTQSRYIHR